jgi:hypothetical protein
LNGSGLALKLDGSGLALKLGKIDLGNYYPAIIIQAFNTQAFCSAIIA